MDDEHTGLLDYLGRMGAGMDPPLARQKVFLSYLDETKVQLRAVQKPARGSFVPVHKEDHTSCCEGRKDGEIQYYYDMIV